ncbi:phage baseplate protein [Leptothoe sp. LEGE 181152]|nr:phage baseplate protein [Leptothoe sp. LEGE 181152]
MKGLTAANLLTVWEQGISQSTAQRGLLLLIAACPGQSPEQLVQLSIGQRDSHLLTLREQILGSNLVSVVNCPSCNNALELNFAVSDIRQPSVLESTSGLLLTTEDYEIKFRLPNSLDLCAVEQMSNVAQAAQQILERCILSVHYQGQPVLPNHIPPSVNQALLEKMEQADQQADIQLAVSCPDCGHQWQAPFDILSFFWQELTAWAQRILQDVHQLASAYGWREADILAMSPQRRQFYLEIIHQ